MTLHVIFHPYHSVRTILAVPFCPYQFVHTILSNTILFVYHFVHTILSVPFCLLPFCRRTVCAYQCNSLQIRVTVSAYHSAHLYTDGTYIYIIYIYTI